MTSTNGKVNVGMPNGPMAASSAPWAITVKITASTVNAKTRAPGEKKMLPSAIAVRTALNPNSPLVIEVPLAPTKRAVPVAIAEPMRANAADQRELTARATTKMIPVTTLLIRNTWATLRNSVSRSIETEMST